MNYSMLEIGSHHMIFEIYVEGIDLEIRVNCEVDENHEKGLGGETIMLDCPKMKMEEINAQRFLRDYKILGFKAIEVYQDRYAYTETKIDEEDFTFNSITDDDGGSFSG